MIEQNFLVKIKLILKSKKGLVILGLLVIASSLLAGIYLASDQQKKKQALDQRDEIKESQQGKPNTIVKNELIVEFKDEYAPEKLEELYKKEQANKGLFGFFEQASEIEKRYLRQKELFDRLNVIGFEKISPQSVNTYLLKFERTNVKDAKNAIDRSGMAQESSFNIYMELLKLPNDTYINQQKAAIDTIKLPEAWDITTGSENIQVAVIDSGIDSDHPDLRGGVVAVSDADVGSYKLKPSFQDTKGHGTHVAGIIGALGNNGTGIAGVNWKVKMVAINVAGDGKFTLGDVLRGVYYAMDNKIKIINLSLGSDLDEITEKAREDKIIGPNEQVTCSDFPTFFRNIERFNALGGVVVAAAGNENKDASRSFPSCNGDKILNVAAINSQDVRGGCERNKCFSNYGNTVHLAAPGVRVLSVKSSKCQGCEDYGQEAGGYMYNSGTSMAAPFVSGAAALLLSVNPNLNSEQIRKCLVDYADSFTPKDGKPIGKRLNVAKSLAGCKDVQGGPKAASSQDEGYPRLGIIEIGPRCVVAGEKVNVRVRGEAKSDDFPIIMVNAFYRRMGQDINGKDRTGESWTRFFEDRNVGDKRVYTKEVISFSAPPYVEVDKDDKFTPYDVVINVHTHKALNKGGGAFAEKFCSGNPFQSELDFANAADCGSGGRQVLLVAKQVSHCPADMRAGLRSLSDPSLRAQDIPPSGGAPTSGNPVPDKDYTCEYKPTVNSDGTLNLTSLECKSK